MSEKMYKFNNVNKYIDDANLRIDKIKDNISYKKSLLEKLKEEKEKLLLKIEEVEQELSYYPQQIKKCEENIQYYQEIIESKRVEFKIDEIILYMYEIYTCENGKYYSNYEIIPSFLVESIIGYEEVERTEYDRTDATCSLSGNMHCEEESYKVIEKEPIYRYDRKMDSNYKYLSDKREILDSYLDKYEKDNISKNGYCYNIVNSKFRFEELVNEMKQKGYDFEKINNYVDSETIKLVAIYVCNEYSLDNDSQKDKYVLTSNDGLTEENSKTMMLKK